MKTLKLLTSISVIAAAVATTPAMAQGTASGTTITNEVTVSYKVGGVDQTPVTADTAFKVDRKINLTVAASGGTTNVSPGQSSAVTTFIVTNTSNATLDFSLAVANQAGGTAANGGTDVFDVTGIKIYLDTNDDGVFNPDDDTEVTYLDEIEADGIRRVFVVSDIPAGATNGQVAGVRLTATAREAGDGGSLGAAITETADANDPDAVDTVFADTDANGNVARDGAHFADSDYTVAAASLSVTKISRIISDPLNDISNPKMIPGAVVEYCVVVSNAASSATATNVSITDPLPMQTTYVANSIFVNGTESGGVCSGGAQGGSHNAGTVTGTLDDIPAGETKTMRFRVTVN